MRTRLVLDSTDANAIVIAAKEHAAVNNWAVSIAVVDAAGQLMAFIRQDDASPISIDLALAKARTAAKGRRSTQAYETMVNEGRVSLATASGLTCVEGGIPLFHGKTCVGAIGVSGVASAEDARIAQVGVDYLLQMIDCQ